MGFGIPDYKNLDLSGEARLAAQNMEDRAQEPASQALFDHLVAPMLSSGMRVLEFGCGTGALAGRIAAHCEVLATDKSEGMIEVARALRPHLDFRVWDVTSPLPESKFDLIISSVVAPYLSDEELVSLIERLQSMLTPGGILAFIEQDVSTMEITSSNPEIVPRVIQRAIASVKSTHLCLGLLSLMKGFETMPVESFDWTDTTYCPYVRRLLARIARDLDSEEETSAWLAGMEDLAARGEFQYLLTYRRIAGRSR